VRNDSRFCQIPTGSKKGLNRHLRPRNIFMVVGLSFILITTGLTYYLIQPSPLPYQPLQLTPHGAIEIDGDANFAATALLEEWPGDGSPENPYIIDGLEIDLGDGPSHCIDIRNTRVSFIISNCNLTGAYPLGWQYREAGIHLNNVTNGELVENIVDSNYNGIILYKSDYNTVVNNTFNNNTRNGIALEESDSNTVINNICNKNNFGIRLGSSNHNTVANNTCNNNDYGIHLYESHSNTVTDNICNNNRFGIYLDNGSESNTMANNTCNSNRIGIYLTESDSNTVENNTFLGNTEHDIAHEFELEELATEESSFDELAQNEFVAREVVE
ncbi:MAG: right-handed parallel beta-helix repeat-containing protein, partial [Candidatus Thorarchaeota archaeon]